MTRTPRHTTSSIEYYEPAERVYTVDENGKPLNLIDIIPNGESEAPYSCLLCETDFRSWAEAAFHLKQNGVKRLAVKS